MSQRTTRLTADEHTAVWRDAAAKLAPLLDKPAKGDIVHRVLPPAPDGSNPTVALADAMDVLSSRYSDKNRRTTRLLIASMSLGLTIGPAVFISGVNAASDKTGYLEMALSIVAGSGLLGAIVIGLGGLLVFFDHLFVYSRSDRIEAAALVEDADLTGLVTVVNPDSATAFALERARTFATNAADKDLYVMAYQHYYELACEVAHGTAGTAAGTRADQWAQGWARWCAIDDAWADIVCDPLSALTHSELLDVTLPRTAAFVTAFAEAKDAMAGRTVATTPVDLSGLLRLINTAETTWVEARDHAEHAGYNWLPETERAKAALAEKLLVLAADGTAPMPERANAAAKASRLLEQITTVRLPEKARTELTSLARKALPASTGILDGEVDRQAGPILAPARVAQPA